MTPKFSTRVVRAGGWTLLQNFLTQSLSLLRVVILARLITPSEFGLFAVALVALVVVEAFSTTGIQEALIQKQGDVEARLNVAWTIQFVRGGLLAAALFVSAEFIAEFLGATDASSLIQLISLMPLIRSLESIGVVRLHRELVFKSLAKLTLLDSIASLAISAAATTFVAGQFALVIGVIGGALVRTISSYVICFHLPRFSWSKEEAKALFKYGRWITVNRILFLFLSRIDVVVVSKLAGAASLGTYQMAQRVSEVSTKSLSAAVGSVAFSAYSRVQSDPVRLRRAFLFSLEAVSLFAIPVAAFVCVSGEFLVGVILGQQWGAVVSILPWMIIAACIRSIAGVFGSFYKAIGKPNYDLIMNVGRGCILCALAWPMTGAHGLIGMAATLMIASFSLLPFMLYSLRLVGSFKVSDAVWAVVPAILVALGMVVSFFATTVLFEGAVSFYVGVVLSVCAVLLISYLNYLFNRRGVFGILKVLHDSRK